MSEFTTINTITVISAVQNGAGFQFASKVHQS